MWEREQESEDQDEEQIETERVHYGKLKEKQSRKERIKHKRLL